MLLIHFWIRLFSQQQQPRAIFSYSFKDIVKCVEVAMIVHALLFHFLDWRAIYADSFSY